MLRGAAATGESAELVVGAAASVEVLPSAGDCSTADVPPGSWAIVARGSSKHSHATANAPQSQVAPGQIAKQMGLGAAAVATAMLLDLGVMRMPI